MGRITLLKQGHQRSFSFIRGRKINSDEETTLVGHQ